MTKAFVIVFVLVVVLAGLLFYIIKRNKRSKQPKITNVKAGEIEVQPDFVKGRTAGKPIICPECIAEKSQMPSTLSEDGEIEGIGAVLVFDSWIPYAAHLLQHHPNSTRIQWAISCVKDEVTRLNERNEKTFKKFFTKM